MIGRTALIIGWMTVMVGASQVLPITRIVYNPTDVLIDHDSGEVVLKRTFPMDVLKRIGIHWRPEMTYIETVRPLTVMHNLGHPCQISSKPFRYSLATVTGTWNITPWAAECLNDPQGFEWEARWFWQVGTFRMGPTRLQATVLRTDPPRRFSAIERLQQQLLHTPVLNYE